MRVNRSIGHIFWACYYTIQKNVVNILGGINIHVQILNNCHRFTQQQELLINSIVTEKEEFMVTKITFLSRISYKGLIFINILRKNHLRKYKLSRLLFCVLVLRQKPLTINVRHHPSNIYLWFYHLL